jgi:hypothetical protein
MEAFQIWLTGVPVAGEQLYDSYAINTFANYEKLKEG